MIKQQLLKTLDESLKANAQRLNLTDANGSALALLNVERPKPGTFGDYAVNVSPLAKLAKLPPPQIAAIVMESLPQAEWSPSVAGGFINFLVSEASLVNSLVHQATAEAPGKNDSLKSMHCLLEFVSANPTGPLHIGHGRWVSLGDSLARVLAHCGADVHREFYVNDAGKQMHNLANSIWYRCLEILETGGRMPDPVEGQKDPFYRGEFVTDLAQGFLAENKDAVLSWDNPEHTASPEALAKIAAYGKAINLTDQSALMAKVGLTFDQWFSEQKDLYDQGRVDAIVEELKQRGVTYEQDGALWFASSRFGDDQDRVLRKSDGTYTYLTPDIAYHHEKFTRRDGYYNAIVNIWGADHHGYIPRMKAAMQALGHDPDRLEIILGQLVNLKIAGERTRMGKRKQMITFGDLVDEVGVDAVRFWMVSKSQDTALDFDVDLAVSQSDENPVFYVQYAHARCASILRNAFQPRLDTLTQTELPSLLTESRWQDFLSNLNPTALTGLFANLENDQAHSALKELILKLDSFDDRVQEAARQRMPHILVRYTLDVAADFHRFYNVCRILVADPDVAMQRLVVIYTLRRVLAQAFNLLGVSAPERM